jgi:hypothetical protein
MSEPTAEDLRISKAMRDHEGQPTKLEKDEITLEIEKPNGRDPFQNAWLTLTLGYRLHFIDSKVNGVIDSGDNKGQPIIVKDDEMGGLCARDAGDYLYPILDWGYKEKTTFAKLFQMGERIWNYNFLIKPPDDWKELDYSSPALPGYSLRPNILCLFRMVAGAKISHDINVVRINPTVYEDKNFRVPKYKTGEKREVPRVDFQSHSTLLKDSDVYTQVLGHELGHMIGEDHILAMKGDAQCKVNPNEQRCYGLTPEERANIMGGGRQMTQINARPWNDALKSFYPEKGKILDTTIVMLTDPKVQPLPPRRIADPKPTPAPGRRR